MQNTKLPKPKNLGPRSVLGLYSPLTLLAQAEASFKTQKARLRAQQEGVATGKKGALRAAWGLLRYLWGKITDSKAYPIRITICLPCYTSLYSGKIYRETPLGQCECDCEFGDIMRRLSPQAQKGRG